MEGVPVLVGVTAPDPLFVGVTAAVRDAVLEPVNELVLVIVWEAVTEEDAVTVGVEVGDQTLTVADGEAVTDDVIV